MGSSVKSTFCRNPHCGDELEVYLDHPFNLCPSCWFIGKVGFSLGTAIVLVTSFVLGLFSH